MLGGSRTQLKTMQHKIPILFLSTFLLFRLRSSKSSIFVKPENQCNLQKIHIRNGRLHKFHSYKGGDYSDIFLETPKSSQFESFFSIPANQSESMPCYIDIEYFSIRNGTGTYILNDTVMLTNRLEMNKSLEEPSNNGTWVTLSKESLNTQSEAYILRSTSGKSFYK